MRLGAAAVFATALLLGAAREARAFCRSTACEPAKENCTWDDNGCPRSGPPLSWRSLPIPYRFHAGGSEKLDMVGVREATRRAFDTWSNVTCNGKRTSLRFEEGNDIPGNAPLTEKQTNPTTFGIYFRDDNWPGTDPQEALAQTNQKYGKTNGWIDYSAIEINTSDREFRLSDAEKTGIDFQAVITHEVGHYIGLAHSKIETSIMVPSYCQSSDRCGASTDESRALAEDDVTAVCAMYPPSGIAGVSYEDPSASSCAVSASGSHGDERRSPAFPLATAIALGALFVMRKRGG
ncbi:MAG: hypothetical protein JWP87_2416 [Labilithrix sp.]|nr:hypothetical protein [Labilithrix sp.]